MEKVYKRIAFNGQEITCIVSERLNKLDPQKQLPAHRMAEINAHLLKHKDQILEIMKKHEKK